MASAQVLAQSELNRHDARKRLTRGVPASEVRNEVVGVNAATSSVLAGSAVFLVGASIAVPRVFTEPDHERKLRVLETGLVWWRLGQPLYAAGALVASGGIGFLAASAAAGPGRAWLTVSCLLIMVGALCWSWSIYQRGQTRPRVRPPSAASRPAETARREAGPSARVRQALPRDSRITIWRLGRASGEAPDRRRSRPLQKRLRKHGRPIRIIRHWCNRAASP